MADLLALEQRATSELAACDGEESLRAWNNRYFGKHGEMAQALKEVGKVPAAERPAYGQEANRIKQALLSRYENALSSHKERELARSLSSDALDVTLPGRPAPRGRLHPATQTLRRIYAIFADLGFQIYRSRDVEDDLTNFELLNMPPHHPAPTCGTPSTQPPPACCCERIRRQDKFT